MLRLIIFLPFIHVRFVVSNFFIILSEKILKNEKKKLLPYLRTKLNERRV